MQTTVLGAGTIKFYWKVSSEAGDSLRFYIDGQYQYAISGSIGWTERTFNVTGLGLHTLRWTYSKDASDSSYSDCGWVDYVQWTPATRTPSANLANVLDTSLDVVTGGNASWWRI